MKSQERALICEFCPDSYTALMTLKQARNPGIVSHLRSAVSGWNVPHAQMLDRFTNLNRDYLGRFFDPSAGFVSASTGRFIEAFVDMEPLEDAPYEWWRDTFNLEAAQSPVLRVRVEAAARWQAIGSIYKAWHPSTFHMVATAANDNWRPNSLMDQ